MSSYPKEPKGMGCKMYFAPDGQTVSLWEDGRIIARRWGEDARAITEEELISIMEPPSDEQQGDKK